MSAGGPGSGKYSTTTGTFHTKVNNDLIIPELFFRLPRELRDRIYKFCVRGLCDDEVIVRRPTAAMHTTSFLVRESAGKYAYRWIEDPIHINLHARALGPDAAREMLQAYYWTRVFKVSHRELHLLAAFLRSDRYGLGIVPMDYIRRLQVQLVAGHGACTHMPGEREKRDVNLRAIDTLSIDLTTRTEIGIEIALPGELADHCDGSRPLCYLAEHVLDVLRTVGRLRERGFRVTVLHNELWGLSTGCANSAETLDSHLAEIRALGVGTKVH